MRPALLITAKDLRLRVRDRSVFLFAFVVPIGLAFLFSAILPDVEQLEVRAAVVDLDGGELAASFADQVLPAAASSGALQLGTVADVPAAEAALRAGDLDAVWVLPEGFGDAVTSGAPATVEVLVSADAPIAGEVARGVATAWTSRLDAGATAVVAAQALEADVDLQQLAAAAVGSDPGVRLDALLAPDRQLDTASYLAAGMAAFFVFFTVQFGVIGLLEERELGTLPRLLASPIPSSAVQVGKSIGAVVLGVVSMTALAVAARLFLGADWGPPLGVAILIVATVLAATGLMAFVGTFARTAEQASNYQSIVAIVLGMLGGVFIPLPVSGVLGVLGRASPHGWFLRGIADQSASGDPTDVLPAAAAILAFGVVAAIPAVWRLRREVAW